jgi:hypothetical protein
MIAAAAAFVLVTASNGFAQNERAAASEVKKSGEISYVSGGVGDEEQKRLAEMARDFNLKVTFAGSSGAYGGGSRVEIRDKSGKTVLDAESRGPLFYAQLPPGTHTVTATGAGAGGQKKTVQIAEHGRADVMFTVQQAEGPRPATDPRSAER